MRVQPHMRTNSGDVCRAVALAHQGIVLQPTFLSGRTCAQASWWNCYRTTRRRSWAFTRSRKHLLPKVRSLIDYLAEVLQQEPAAKG